MAAQADVPASEPPPLEGNSIANLWKKIMKKSHFPSTSPRSQRSKRSQDSGASRPPSPTQDLIRRVSRKVVPGLPRVKTFKRQQSELREKLEPILPSPAERRAVSVDRRLQSNRNLSSQRNISHHREPLPRGSAPDFLDDARSVGAQDTMSHNLSQPQTPADDKPMMNLGHVSSVSIESSPALLPQNPRISTLAASSTADIQSITTSQYDVMIHDELESKWILNLSMHFRDKSQREKFFVTYREKDSMWRRVTISLDYRRAPEDSLEQDLHQTKYQRDKSAKIYEAIRESLQDIQFYDTVTNLKLQTTDGRLHVHVVEDVNEIIPYPTVHMVQHLRCRRIREREIQFDSHMSGFVYKVRVDGRPLIKKEIPGPDTVEEFLYEVNALNHLGFSESVIEFYGVVVDDEEHVKGLLISYAEKGALIDLIYDSQEHALDLPWSTREKWAKQIVNGLADIHESGFVQGDFTLSNIVIDRYDNAKIIDINRRGCPVGWEPPEATPLIDSNQRISMYIGVKSDLYQLGMVLWALATQEDEPEAHPRPLRLSAEIKVPPYYRKIVAYCLHESPRVRKHAKELLEMFPETTIDYDPNHMDHRIPVDYSDRFPDYHVAAPPHSDFPEIRVVEPQDPYPKELRMSPDSSEEPYYYPPRGRSPPSPMPSNHDRYYSPDFASMGAYANMASPNLNGTRAETPRDIQAQEAMDKADQLVRDLGTLEEGLQDEPAGERAQATGGESRTAEAAPVKTNGAQVPANVSDWSREGDIPFKDGTRSSSDYSDQHTEVTSRDATPHSQVRSRPRTDNITNYNQREVVRAEGSRDNGKGKGKGKEKRRMEATARLEHEDESGEEDLETRSSGANYTHDRKEEGPTRTTEARHSSDNEPRSRESPTTHGTDPNDDLMGVGSAYDNPIEFRPPFSDEDIDDLGVGSTLAHDVNMTSMA